MININQPTAQCHHRWTQQVVVALLEVKLVPTPTSMLIEAKVERRSASFYSPASELGAKIAKFVFLAPPPPPPVSKEKN